MIPGQGRVRRRGVQPHAEKLGGARESRRADVRPPRRAVTPGGIAVTMVSNDQVLKELVAATGASPALGAGIHVSMSTISPDTSRELAKLHAAFGGHYVAAPVFGRRKRGGGEALDLQSGPVLAKRAARRCWRRWGSRCTISAKTRRREHRQALRQLHVLSPSRRCPRPSPGEKNGIDRAAMAGFFGETCSAADLQELRPHPRRPGLEPAGFQLALGMKDVKLARGAAESAEISMR